MANVRLTGSEAVQVQAEVKHRIDVVWSHVPTPIIASKMKNAANALISMISLTRLALSLSILKVVPSTRLHA